MWSMGGSPGNKADISPVSVELLFWRDARSYLGDDLVAPLAGHRQRGGETPRDLGRPRQEEAIGHTASEDPGGEGETPVTAGSGLGPGCESTEPKLQEVGQVWGAMRRAC